MNAQVSAVKYRDINDKELLYLVIQNSQGKVIINIGQKTFDKVKSITTEEKLTDENNFIISAENQKLKKPK